MEHHSEQEISRAANAFSVETARGYDERLSDQTRVHSIRFPGRPALGRQNTKLPATQAINLLVAMNVKVQLSETEEERKHSRDVGDCSFSRQQTAEPNPIIPGLLLLSFGAFSAPKSSRPFLVFRGQLFPGARALIQSLPSFVHFLHSSKCFSAALPEPLLTTFPEPLFVEILKHSARGGEDGAQFFSDRKLESRIPSSRDLSAFHDSALTAVFLFADLNRILGEFGTRSLSRFTDTWYHPSE